MTRGWFQPFVTALLLAAGLWSTTAVAEPIAREKVLAALPKMEAMAQELVDSGAVPGLAVAVVHDDVAVFLEGFGLRKMGEAERVSPDTVFQLASMSKPISSTVIASLVSRGLLGWQSRIAELNPAFQLHDPYPTAQVTLRDLLSHSSGLPGTAGDDLEEIGYDRDTIMLRLRLVPPSSSFRAGYAYSNAGFTQAALAAARATGKTWEDVAQDEIYGPLGMTSTSSRHAEFLARANRAALHVRVNGEWTAGPIREPDAQAPAGGVSSSIRDLAEWMRLELGHGTHAGSRLIAPEAIGATHEPLVSRGSNPVSGAASFYALGWNVEYGRYGLGWGHAGAFSTGARTLVTLYPDAGLGIVVLSNAFPTGVPEALADSFFDLVFTGAVTRDWLAPWNAAYEGLFGPAIAAAKAAYTPPPQPTPALPMEAYVGTYANDYVGVGSVVIENRTLLLKVGPDGVTTYPLTHFDRDMFLYYPTPELPDLPASARFTVGSDGHARSVTAESLDDNGLGTLMRIEVQ